MEALGFAIFPLRAYAVVRTAFILRDVLHVIFFFAKYTVHSFSPKVKIRIAVFLWDGVTISYG